MKKITLLAASALALAFGSTTLATQDDPGTTVTKTVEKPLPDNASLQMGGAMVRGLHNPGELADLIHTSLLKDPTGNMELTPTRCKKSDGDSCAKPIDYLNALIKWHSESGITDLSQLEGFIRGLNSNVIAEGDYLSARMVGDRLDITSGFHRHLAKGEHAWTDPKTGQPTLMENCGNVMAPAPVEEVVVGEVPCPTITYNVPQGADDVFVPVFGPKELPEHIQTCNWGVKQPGDSKFEEMDICPSDSCFEKKRVWTANQGRPVNYHLYFRYHVKQAGLNTLRLPVWIADELNSILVCPKGHGGRWKHAWMFTHPRETPLHDYPLPPFKVVPPGTPLPEDAS